MEVSRWIIARIEEGSVEMLVEDGATKLFFTKEGAKAYRDQHAVGWKMGQVRVSLMSKLFDNKGG